MGCCSIQGLFPKTGSHTDRRIPRQIPLAKLYPLKYRSRTFCSRPRIGLRILWSMVKWKLEWLASGMQESILHSMYYTLVDINIQACSLAAWHSRIIPSTVHRHVELRSGIRWRQGDVLYRWGSPDRVRRPWWSGGNAENRWCMSSRPKSYNLANWS